jgi:pheromone shutdown protein TraB
MSIKIIGTTHLTSKEEVEALIKSECPDIIGIELCDARVYGIRHEEELKKIKRQQDGSILNKITSAIKDKAYQQGLDYGSDMKAALSYSIDNNVPYVLVDMPIQKIQELFSKIPLNEQQGFMKELLEFESQSLNQNINEEEVLINLKTRYPIAFEFLVNMRNLYITNQILRTMLTHPNKRITIVLGKAHVKAISKMVGIQQ